MHPSKETKIPSLTPHLFLWIPCFLPSSSDSRILLPVSLPSPTASWLPPTQPPQAVLTQATGGLWLVTKSSGIFFFFLISLGLLLTARGDMRVLLCVDTYASCFILCCCWALVQVPPLSLCVALRSRFISGLWVLLHFNQNQLHSFQGAWQRKMRGRLFKRTNEVQDRANH